ncbi:MAG TPA: coenzyme F420-0:L-glutamate ligase [Bacillota bacterium]
MSSEVRIVPIEGLPEVKPGDDLGAMLVSALRAGGRELVDHDIVVIAQKVVSKAEGRMVDLTTVRPGPEAARLAARDGKDARLAQLVLDEAADVVRMERGVWIVRTRHGFVCANAGIDQSNAPPDHAILLPIDADESARRLKQALDEAFNAQVAVIISDTFGRPWRLGQVNVAVGLAGMAAVLDYRGQVDDSGRPLKVTAIAVADELAAAAELVMGKTRRVAAALVRGFRPPPGDGRARDLVRPVEEDLFR